MIAAADARHAAINELHLAIEALWTGEIKSAENHIAHAGSWVREIQ